MIQQIKIGSGHPSPWLIALVARKPPKPAAVALANKGVWKLMVNGERYDRDHAAAARAGRTMPDSAVAASGEA